MIDKPMLQKLRVRLNEELKKIGEEFSVEIIAGNCRFNSANANMKLTINSINDNGEVITKEVRDFNNMALMYGLKPTDLGREFVSQGKTFKISGLKRSAHKYPILATARDGKVYKFPEKTVALCLKTQD